MILDGEAVALDESGVPSFGQMQNRARSTRVEYWAFDILHLDGRSLLRAKYSDRRRILEALADGGGLIVPDPLPGDGPEALEYARKQRWEGVVAKKRDSTYQPGRRSSSWIKDKIWNTQEVVIGGWRGGKGGRSSGIGALMLGIPDEDGLHFVGRVGTGFTEKALTKLRKTLEPLETDESPFNTRLTAQDAKGVTFVRPELVGEVRYSERTSDGRLRQPSWRGLRLDKEPGEVGVGVIRVHPPVCPQSWPPVDREGRRLRRQRQRLRHRSICLSRWDRRRPAPRRRYSTNMGAPIVPGVHSAQGEDDLDFYHRNGSIERVALDGSKREYLVPEGGLVTGKQLAGAWTRNQTVLVGPGRYCGAKPVLAEPRAARRGRGRAHRA